MLELSLDDNPWQTEGKTQGAQAAAGDGCSGCCDQALMLLQAGRWAQVQPWLYQQICGDAVCGSTHRSKWIWGMVKRGRKIKPYMPLEANAVQTWEDVQPSQQSWHQHIRAWHFILTGGILLFEGQQQSHGMQTDDRHLRLQALFRFKVLLRLWQIQVPRVFIVPDAASGSFGGAVARLLGCPAVHWNDTDQTLPGVIVVEELAALSPGLQQQLIHHHFGQILWSHRSASDQPQPYAADVTTLLYAQSAAEIQSGWKVHPPGHGSCHPKDEHLAQSKTVSIFDQARLVALARTLSPGEHGAAALQSRGDRLPQPRY